MRRRSSQAKLEAVEAITTTTTISRAEMILILEVVVCSRPLLEAALVRFRLILHSNRVSTAEVPEPGGSRGRYTASLQLSSLPSIHAFFVPRTTCTEEATVEPPTLRVEEEEDSTTYTVANLETRSLLRTIPTLLVVLCSVANFWERIIVLKTRQNSFFSKSDFVKN